MFEDREDAARRLAVRLAKLPLKSPVVLAIPRGGVVVGAVLAQALGAELDVVLARKLRAPWQPELAIGSVGEDGDVYLNQFASEVPGLTPEYLNEERERRRREINNRLELVRSVRRPARLAGRSVIVTDDGIATAATMLAAVRVLRAKQPAELIVAIPVAPASTLKQLAAYCDRIECLMTPRPFASIGAFFTDFEPVEDSQVEHLLRQATASAIPHPAAA